MSVRDGAVSGQYAATLLPVAGKPTDGALQWLGLNSWGTSPQESLDGPV
jgi:hypothetical protein